MQAEGTAGVVVVHAPGGQGFACTHEKVTRAGIAQRLAVLKGYAFAGDGEAAQAHAGPVYLVPSDTLVGVEAARVLGVRGEDDLFGGVAPHRFVATKAITHGLVEPGSAAPEGWSPAFADAVREVVLRGFTVFASADARQAGARLLERGAVRVKPVHATGGTGQSVARDAAALDAILAAMDEAELAEHGLVLEENLTEVTTYSVGQVRVADLLATYYGTQRLTPGNDGVEVYGGSELVVVRGGFEALLGLSLPETAREAVAQARAYDDAAAACFPGLLLSRRNYDVARGLDAAGQTRSGVLEQSWRLGGASGAEIAALEAFRADPALQVVRAATVELYGEGIVPPPHATVYFQGNDEKVGPITKYAVLEAHDDPR